MQNYPAIHAQVTPHRTRKGLLITVALITPAEIHWRTYPPMPPEEAAARALKSCGLKQAEVWASLPKE